MSEASATAAAVVGGVLALAAPAADALPRNDHRIVLQQRIGPYRYVAALKAGRSYASAVAAFGVPTSRGTLPGTNVCTVRWRAEGLDVRLASARPVCAPANLTRGTWYGATVSSRRWSTARGLRVGDTVARMRSLYPGARFRDLPPDAPTWSLVRRRQDERELELLRVTVWDGRVRTIELGAGYVF